VIGKLSIRSGWTWIFLAIIFSGCQTSSASQPTEQERQTSLLVSLDAPTHIKREGWTDYQPVGFGTLVYPTDLLKTEGQIMLLCADLLTVESLTGMDRNPCPLPQHGPTLSYDGMWFSASVRSTPQPAIPYILYPRSTVILESNPLLRWNDTNAVSYTVEIWQGANVIWQQTNVTGNTLMYPIGSPKLVARKDYLLVVTDNSTNLDSNADPNKSLGFQVVSADQRADFEQQKEDILSLTTLAPEARKLALALIYQQMQINGRGLWGESHSLLEEVVQAQPNAPVVYLRLGDTLSNMKLWNEAKIAYETAIVRAQALSDLESQAEAFAALWRINGDQANFDQAIDLYEQIGAQDQAERLRNSLTHVTQ
jgi:hypothetical protein